MEDRLSVLKSTFGGIVDLKEGNIQVLKVLDSKIQQIKTMYTDFIQSNREQLFVFTLDAFHFQSKLVDLEFEDMNRMFLSITNRMYCDYYKLFKIMVEYVEENIPEKKLQELIRVHNNFPVYKDLEPFKQYDFQYIQSLHEIILVILTYIHTFITNKEHDLKVYQTKNQTGLNIDSFVSTFSFNTTMMNQRAMLFINYIEFFHKSHTKYLKRFTMKLNLMLSQLNNDIKMDSPTETKTVKKDMIADLKDQNVDRALLKELRVSISADDMSVHSQSRTSGSSSSSSEETSDKFSPQELPEFIVHRPIIETLSELTDEPEIKKSVFFNESLRQDPSPSSEQQAEWGEQIDPFIEPQESIDSIEPLETLESLDTLEPQEPIEEDNINLTIYDSDIHV
jgi:hypothetical protein